MDLNTGTYFLTLTVQRWHYLFDRHHRWRILADSIRYRQEHKRLELNGYVARSEHWVWSSANPDSPLTVKILA